MNTHETLREKILARIERGDVRMRPRFYFTFQMVSIAVLCFLIALVSVFTINFISFMLRAGGHDSLLGFGPRGVAAFVAIFPWGWLALDAALIACVVFLFRRFRFGYRRPVLIVVGAFIALALVGGIALDRGTPFNDDLLQGADHDALPLPLGPLYELVHEPPPHDQGLFRGVVSTIGSTTFMVAHDDFDHDHDDGTFVVIPPPGFDLSSLMLGERLYIAGSSTPSGIQAYGIHPLQQ